jgi:signal transduction histidine kinase
MKRFGKNSLTSINSAYTGGEPMSPRHALRPILLVSALGCLLLLLAFLQYRWSGQVTEAERLRMQSSLQLAVDQFRREFSRDLLAIGTGLQAEPEAIESADWTAVAVSQAEWLSSAAAAHLVSAVYLLRPDGQLLLLDAAHSAYAETRIPADLNQVVSRLTAGFDEHRPSFPRNSAWAMDGTGPMLLHSINVSTGPPSEHRAGFQIVTLNRDALAKKFLPELAARHFGGPDGFLYQVQVYVADHPRAAIYNFSGAPFLKPADADLDTELIEARPRGGPDRGPRDRGGRLGFRDWRPRNERGGFPPPDTQRGGFFGMPLLVSDGFAPWKLAVRHRSGSVAAAVETLRWRNLSVSFAILLVLGISMVTIVRGTQRAQRLAELQMEFVAGVSHELRTPLAVISSAAENLTDGVVEGAGQVKQYGSLIRNESRRLAGMMEQILQFAAGQKRRDYRPELLRIEDLLEGALALSQTVLTEGGFTVEQSVAPNLPVVRGESGALTQCLQNLVSNAAKYSGVSRWIGIHATAEAGWVVVTVEDRGIGIDKSDLPHLFDAFYRAKSVRSAQIHGTGLGLNLARSFARDAGGDVTVESTAGQGSRFTLRLPADPASVPEPARLLDQTA